MLKGLADSILKTDDEERVTNDIEEAGFGRDLETQVCDSPSQRVLPRNLELNHHLGQYELFGGLRRSLRGKWQGLYRVSINL